MMTPFSCTITTMSFLYEIRVEISSSALFIMGIFFFLFWLAFDR